MNAPEPVLSDRMLREEVLRMAPDLPDRARARIRVLPARAAARGDLSTDAALFATTMQGRQGFAVGLAARLAVLDGIGSADATPSGHVNLRYSDTALAGILAAAAGRAARRPPDDGAGAALKLPLSALVLGEPIVAIQYAHARCRSVLRAARAFGPAFEAAFAALPSPGTVALDPAERRTLCRVEHWSRIGPHRPDTRGILLYLRDLSDDFERMWKLGGDDATLRWLYPGDPGRSRVGLALVSATADVIRAGLTMLGMEAAEELQ